MEEREGGEIEREEGGRGSESLYVCFCVSVYVCLCKSACTFEPVCAFLSGSASALSPSHLSCPALPGSDQRGERQGERQGPITRHPKEEEQHQKQCKRCWWSGWKQHL